MNEYVNLNRLEYAVTNLCSSKCIHCFIADEKPRGPQHIDAKLAVQILRDVGQQYPLESVMTFGGEPLLYPEVVCAIHREATRLNIPSRQVITNGYWSKDAQKTRVIAQSLAQAGGVVALFLKPLQEIWRIHQACFIDTMTGEAMLQRIRSE